MRTLKLLVIGMLLGSVVMSSHAFALSCTCPGADVTVEQVQQDSLYSFEPLLKLTCSSTGAAYMFGTERVSQQASIQNILALVLFAKAKSRTITFVDYNGPCTSNGDIGKSVILN